MATTETQETQPVTMAERILDAEARQAPEWVQSHYLAMLSNGEKIKFSHMCAFRQTPRHTGFNNAKFCEAQNNKMLDEPIWKRSWYAEQAKQNGINTAGKFHIPGIAPSDPEAWGTTGDDALRVYKKRNMSCEGVITNKQIVKDEPVKKVKLAEKIIQETCVEMAHADPDLANNLKTNPKALTELREQVVETHGRPD
tara:strand:- start:582 stop:1172 length:591 start_codon:yes stop_codon:yes gene_type:complete